MRTRKTGSSAREIISGSTNWQQSSVPTVEASAPSSCVATTRFSSASLSCARHSTVVSTVCPTSCGLSSPASSTSASAAASHSCAPPGELRSLAEPPLSSLLSTGTHCETTISYALCLLLSSPPSSRCDTSGAASRTLQKATICSANAMRTGVSTSLLMIASSGSSCTKVSSAPICSAHDDSSRTCTSRCTEMLLLQ